MTDPTSPAMATHTPRLHHLARPRYALLLSAVSQGDVTAATALLDADPPAYVNHEQGKALVKACVTAPNAVALLGLFEARRSTLFRGGTHFLADLSFLHACRHGADVATVVRTVQVLHGDSRPDVEEGLLWATKTRNAPLVEYLMTSYEPDLRRDYGALLHAAIKTSDQAFVLGCMIKPAFLAFLASLEASFEPRFIRHVATYRHRHKWIVQAIARGMRAVVEFAAERAPLVTADVVFVHSASCPNGAAKFMRLRRRRETLNHQIEAFHQAIRAGTVDVVDSMLKKVPALRLSCMDNGETALMASVVIPNPIALLRCLRQHGATNHAVFAAFFYACRLGGAFAAHVLFEWIETFNFGDREREAILWEGISIATSHEHVFCVDYLVRFVRDWKSDQIQRFLANATSDWTSEKAHGYVMAAIQSTKGEYVCAVMDTPVVQDLIMSLKANMVCGASNGMDFGCRELYCDCPGSRECDSGESVMSVIEWIDYAKFYDEVLVLRSLDTWWPALTRRAAFERCNNVTDLSHPAVQPWRTLHDRYVRDVTWHHFRLAHLVQRRMLPGLDVLGSLIAAYLHAFDTKTQLRLLGVETEIVLYYQ